ncbi:MAG: MoaD/ThiS family protein [Alphaproteobacteria bacterium]|nr:MoaD/ThiS family protein [Alphaproteobacteria bacterium]
MAGGVLLFGKLKDVFGAASVPFPAGATTAAEVRARLAELNPELADAINARGVRVAVNQKLVADEAGAAVSPGDEIALLPPLSGG